MAAIAKENLDERIERIKKRNEEIEKKYREAEEDRLMALKDNAMVETKPPKDEDWPKGHKYDKVDFTYDVKPEKLEELKQRKQEEVKTKRDYKKFPDGEGPPPDPAYNFLADAERDGIINPKNENKGEKKDHRQNSKNKDSNKRNGPNNNSFRGRGGKTHNSKYQKQNSQPEYEQWRTEREKIDEARINRQKIGDGKWRREWDNDKLNAENEALLRPEKVTLGDTINASIKKSPTHSGKHNSHYSGYNLNTTDCLIEKRGNITVSVSQTGEVKSVKLTSAPVIGTGRVGPRHVSKPQFSVQAVEAVPIQQHAPISPKLQNKEHHKNVNIPQNLQQKFAAQNINQNVQHKASTQNANVQNNPRNPHKTSAPLNTNQQVPAVVPNAVICPPSPIKNKRKSQSNNKYIPPQNVVVPDPPIIENSFITELPIPGANGIVPVDLSHKPEFAKKSVQDRLLRVRQANQHDIQKSSAAKIDLKLTLINKNEDRIEDLEAKCDRTNEGIQSIEPIVACN